MRLTFWVFGRVIENKIKYGMKYVKSGLDVSFDKKSKEQYKNAMISESSFNSFIERELYLHDISINMDW